MAKNADLHDGNVVVRSGSSKETIVQIQIAHDQMLSINVSHYGPGDNQRRINVIWKQGPRVSDPSHSIGYAILDPLNKTLTGVNGEDLTRR
jgi:hypothetical protein